jgi:hypothetical protein
VHEDDRVGLATVADLACELAVDVELVAQLAGIVGHGDADGIEAHRAIVVDQRVLSTSPRNRTACLTAASAACLSPARGFLACRGRLDSGNTTAEIERPRREPRL